MPITAIISVINCWVCTAPDKSALKLGSNDVVVFHWRHGPSRAAGNGHDRRMSSCARLAVRRRDSHSGKPDPRQGPGWQRYAHGANGGFETGAVAWLNSLFNRAGKRLIFPMTLWIQNSVSTLNPVKRCPYLLRLLKSY